MMDTDIREIQLACFRIGDAFFAADIMRIKEILRPQKLTRLPKAPPFVEGVINLRGSVIPVIDLRRRFDLPERTALEEARLLVVAVARQLVGLVEGIGAEYLIGVCLIRDSLVMLLNLDRILTSRETSVLAGIAGMGGGRSAA
jgi:purine-binding chemotaxis protein CheW